MSTFLFLFLCLLPFAGAGEASRPEGKAVDSPIDQQARAMADRLRTDDAAARLLARRIQSSTLGASLGGSEVPATSESRIRAWIKANPGSASHLAIGFAQDDAAGNKTFERSLYLRIDSLFDLNPDRYQGLLGRLDETAKESLRVSTLRDLSDDDRSRMLKDFFAGKGSTARRPQRAPDTHAGTGLYDRINAANPTGYSPEVMAFQSEMNVRRAPGAPRLIETGKLDYATLRYPYFGLRHDIDGLRGNMERQVSWKKATDSSADLFLALREKALARSETALAAFEAEAGKTKTASAVTSARLQALAGHRREAARWVALSSQAEKMARLRVLATFFDDRALHSLIKRTPVEEKTRNAYLGAGKNLQSLLLKAAADGGRAVELLNAEYPTPEDLSEAQRVMGKTDADLKEFSRRVALYQETPGGLIENHRAVSAARAWAEDWAARVLPSSEYGKSLLMRKQRTAELRRTFERIASDQ